MWQISTSQFKFLITAVLELLALELLALDWQLKYVLFE